MKIHLTRKTKIIGVLLAAIFLALTFLPTEMEGKNPKTHPHGRHFKRHKMKKKDYSKNQEINSSVKVTQTAAPEIESGNGVTKAADPENESSTNTRN